MQRRLAPARAPYDLSVDNVLPYLAPDADGRVCASTLYDRCTGAE